jgi:signal transduction histidine kinase/ActR/RegA family two-component response regulator
VLECFLPDGSLASVEQWAIPRALRGEKRENVEYTLRRIDTGETWCGSYSFAPIRDEAGVITGSVMVGRDVTDLKRAATETAALEARLQQSQRLEAVGRLAGGIAHDFNNMLHVIVGNTELALEQVAQGSQAALALYEISSVAKRSTALVRQLLAFARRQSIVPRVMDLNVTIQGMLQMLRRLLGEHIELRWTPGTALWPVRIDPSQLDQILVNLCVNARDAVTQGAGFIAIETRNVVVDDAARALLPELSAGEYVRISVSDNGSGMDAATISSIFEPFFTTKPLGEGTGLGLSTVYGAVKQHGGVLSVQSTPGGGSTFTIHLPRDRGALEVASTPPEPQAAPAASAETILLVEDEPAVLRMTERMLRKRGYCVWTATSPSEALSVARVRGAEISALVSDVMMPEMTGIELARQLSAIIPRVKTLFISGYADHLQGRAAPGEHFLQKPYTTDALLKALRRVLDDEVPQPLPDRTAAPKPG